MLSSIRRHNIWRATEAYTSVFRRHHVSVAPATSPINPGIPPSSFPKPPPNPGPKPSSRITAVPSAVLSYYYDTDAPSSSELRRADRFFTDHRPVMLFSAGKFYQVKLTSVPEVAFLGRSNVGKSSLLNALMGEEICHTSNTPGRTRTMNGFAVGGQDRMGNPGRLTVLDMPGYGKGSREEWGDEIVKYLVKRKELRRVFLLVDAMHGLKKSDEQILKLFRHNAVPHQVILSKVDRVLLPKTTKKHIAEDKFEEHTAALKDIVGQIREKIQPKSDGPPALGEILTVSADNERWKALASKTKGKLGIDAVRWAVLVATGLNQQTVDLQIQE